MPTKAEILKALALTGLGGAAGAGAGYHLGKKKGLRQDAMTPYGDQHMTMAYRKGQVDVVNALRQRMQQKTATAHVNLRTPANILGF